MLEKWIAAPPSDAKAVEGNECPWLDFDWLMNFSRFRDDYNAFTATPSPLFGRNIFNKAAQRELGKHLCDKKKMQPGKDIDFDFIGNAENWRDWKPDSHNMYPVLSDADFLEVEGSTVFLGAFGLYALAKGTVKWLSGNEYYMYVKEIAIILWDTFNFDEESGVLDRPLHNVLGLGYWRCEPPDFQVGQFLGSTQIHNGDFRSFRKKNSAARIIWC